jgi:hypothetical protein
MINKKFIEKLEIYKNRTTIKKVVGTKITEEQKNKLDKYCKDNNIKISNIIYCLIEDFIEEIEKEDN